MPNIMSLWWDGNHPIFGVFIFCTNVHRIPGAELMLRAEVTLVPKLLKPNIGRPGPDNAL